MNYSRSRSPAAKERAVQSDVSLRSSSVPRRRPTPTKASHSVSAAPRKLLPPGQPIVERQQPIYDTIRDLLITSLYPSIVKGHIAVPEACANLKQWRVILTEGRELYSEESELVELLKSEQKQLEEVAPFIEGAIENCRQKAHFK